MLFELASTYARKPIALDASLNGQVNNPLVELRRHLWRTTVVYLKKPAGSPASG